MEKTMKLTAVSPVATASDGRKYFVISATSGFGQKPVSRIMWQQFINDKKTGLPTKETRWERGSHEEAMALLNSRESFVGEKVTRRVAKYTLNGGEERNTYSTIVFGDEDVITVFSNAGHQIVDEVTGELLGKARVSKASLATKGDAPNLDFNLNPVSATEEA